MAATSSPVPRQIVLVVRGSVGKAWLDRLVNYDRCSLNELTDRELARYARDVGFQEIPPIAEGGRMRASCKMGEL